ncbi:MAG TPA: hypothetical protein VH420_07015 [Gaiellaceae bacterium]
MLVLALGLLARSSSAIGFALVALGGAYAVLFAAEGARLDRVAPGYAAGLLLVAELSFWSIESRVAAWSDPELVVWRLARLGLACAGAALIGAVVVAEAAAAGRGGGISLEAIGVAAAIGAIALVAALVRRAAVDSGS